MKVVINERHGGFSLSDLALATLRGMGIEYDIEAMVDPKFRAHPWLVETVERLGAAAAGEHATLKIVEIPEGIAWYIDDFAGRETIHEKHREWR